MKAKKNNIPKKAISKPSIVSIIFFIIIVVVYIPNTLFAGVQFIIAIYLAPLAIVGLFLAYNSGISLAKYNHSNLLLSYLILVVIHILCIGACLIVEFILAGYPIKDCFDTCSTIDTGKAIVWCCITSSILFLPAYCGILRYYTWTLMYNLPKSNNK